MDSLRARSNPKSSSKKKNAGSDLGSPRDSEDRQASIPATGRGQKRGRDNEIEKVRDFSSERNSSPSNGPVRKKARSSRKSRSPAKAPSAARRSVPQSQKPALPSLDDAVRDPTRVAIDSDDENLQNTKAGPLKAHPPPVRANGSGEPFTGSLDLASSYHLNICKSNIPAKKKSIGFDRHSHIAPTSESFEWSSMRSTINADKLNRLEVKILSKNDSPASALSSPLSSAPASPINAGLPSDAVNVTANQPALGEDDAAETPPRESETTAEADSGAPTSQETAADDSGALAAGVSERPSARVDSSTAEGNNTTPPIKLNEQPRQGRNRKRRHEDDENENAPASKTQRLSKPSATERLTYPRSKAQLKSQKKKLIGDGEFDQNSGGANAPRKIRKATKETRNQEKFATISRTNPKDAGRIAFYEEVDHDNLMMIAGIPLENTPDDLVPFVQNQRSAVMDLSTVTNKEHLQEEHFHSRPAVKIDVPDHIKALLVDDWENVTKNLSLVPLPSEHPVSEILDTYFEEEKHKRRLGSAEADLLEEVVVGMKDYFDKCLGRLLLYRFEREQYFQVRKLWDEGKDEWEGKNTPSTVYGAEHLCRLFGV